MGIITLEPGDYILLNSDGLTNMISGSEICDIVTSDISLDDKAATLFVLQIMPEGLIT